MMKTFLIVAMMFMIISCNEKTSYQMELYIKNCTDNNIEITLFPKQEYLSGTLYKASAIGGLMRQTQFDISSGSDNSIYITDDLEIEPYVLIGTVFDSIYIKMMNESQTIIKFNTDTLINYSYNIFDSNSEWDFEKVEFDMGDMFNKNPVVSNNYYFMISE